MFIYYHIAKSINQCFQLQKEPWLVCKNSPQKKEKKSVEVFNKKKLNINIFPIRFI